MLIIRARHSLFLHLLASAFLFTSSCRNYAKGQIVSDINHIVHLGQSLAAGEHALPVVTDSASAFGNLSFRIGTHTYTRKLFEGAPEKRDSLNFEFIPLMAHERGHEGETIGNGLCDHLKSTGRSFVPKDFSFLFSFSGQGGRLIRELDKKHDDAKDGRAGDRMSEGGYYQTAVDDVRRAYLTSKRKNLTYSVFAITWMQGESNNWGHVNRWDNPLSSREDIIQTYMTDLLQLKKDFIGDVKAITGQPGNIPFFTYQTFGANVGSAQLKACDVDSAVYMVGPTYMLPNAENSRIWHTQEHGDGIHLTADGERWFGEMFAKVIRKVTFEGQDWDPLRPLKAWKSASKTLCIEFHVPSPPLVIDTLFLPPQGNGYGFRVYDLVKDHKIKNVRILRNNVVELELTDSLAGFTPLSVSYGLESYVKRVPVPLLALGRKDSLINTVQHVQLIFKGDIRKEFETLAKEGVFTLVNQPADDTPATEVLIRNVFLNQYGNTTLLAERGDVTKEGSLKPGQNCTLYRRFAFGNLRDNDNEQSTFKFSDSAYGRRYGEHYPLWNWSVVFQDFPVQMK